MRYIGEGILNGLKIRNEQYRAFAGTFQCVAAAPTLPVPPVSRSLIQRLIAACDRCAAHPDLDAHGGRCRCTARTDARAKTALTALDRRAIYRNQYSRLNHCTLLLRFPSALRFPKKLNDCGSDSVVRDDESLLARRHFKPSCPLQEDHRAHDC